MFEHWDSFYLLIGGAAGGLIGLLFIVATLRSQRSDTEATMRAVAAYMTPIVFHLGAVLSVSAVLAAPGLADPTVGVLLALVAALGLVCAVRIIVRLTSAVQAAHWSDIWCYGLCPLAAYLVVAGGAAAVWLAPDWAARIVAAGLLAQLMIAIRNAWDLVTWMTVKMGATV
ncbi:MAG TPA: hypothetical protein VHV27_02720 [Phenylobacterium sp.]|nr:hypothetical protein [Phenylobacterium sp.]